MEALKKVEQMLAEFAKNNSWGTIEIEIRDGEPVLVRQSTTEKLAASEKNHAPRQRY